MKNFVRNALASIALLAASIFSGGLAGHYSASKVVPTRSSVVVGGHLMAATTPGGGFQTQPAIFIDPVAGSDSNTCITSGSPCKTFAEIVNRWGTNSPYLKQATTITYLSSASDNSDPVIFTPFISGGVTVIIKGLLNSSTQVATGTLASVTAKNRATPTLLKADIGASGAANQLIRNTTHAGTAFVYALVSGTTFALTQPCQNLTTNGLCTEVDTWVNTDAFTLYSPTKINLAYLQGQTADTDVGGNLVVLDAIAYDPAGAGNSTLYLGYNAQLSETNVQRTLAIAAASNYVPQTNEVTNCALQAGVWSGLPIYNSATSLIQAGYIGQPSVVGEYLDADVIIKNSGFASASSLGKVYVDTSQTLTAYGVTNVNAILGAGIVWGPGTFNAGGDAHVVIPSGASKAAAAFPITTLQINGSTKGCLCAPGAANCYATCNITVSAANIDTNLGTTTGCVGVGNAGAFCNTGL